MVRCNLRWSIWEFCFVSGSHLAAAISTLTSDLLLVLELAVCGTVLASYLVYIRDRIRTYCMVRAGRWVRAHPQLIIGEQTASVGQFGMIREMQPPSVVYLSEFLIVLRFLPDEEYGAAKAVQLTLWPDSLISTENRRLRRYLRFDLSDGPLDG